MDFFQNNCQKNNNMTVITWNKKHPSKQVAPITYTLEKKFFAVAAFECL